MSNIKTLISNHQSIWLDSISKQMLDSGDLSNIIDLGITGITSNPSIFDKAISSSDVYDETIRVPLIIAGCNITSHKIVPDLVRHVDIFPTLLDILELPKNNNVDGRSLLPLFSGKKLEEIPAYIETGINLGLLLGKKSEILGKIIGIRTSSYKYWRSRDDPKQNIFLFNLQEDPKEENNVAKKTIPKAAEIIINGAIGN